MANTSAAVLTIFIAWALLLLILMEALRTRLVLAGTVAARFIQSLAHLASTNVFAVNLRFLAFTVQMAIAAYWCWALLR